MWKEKRRKLRFSILREVYYTTKGRRSRKTIPASVELDDPETFFALEYLADKGLIYFRQDSEDSYVAKITSSGKIAIEQGRDLASVAQ